MTVSNMIGSERSLVNNIRSLMPAEKMAEFCKRWKIGELALFGSVLHEEFRPDSDVDVLVSFTSDADWGLLDHVQIQQELESILLHKVDLVTKRAIERCRNQIRRKEILGTAKTIFSNME
jgi:uncharacterized protein